MAKAKVKSKSLPLQTPSIHPATAEAEEEAASAFVQHPTKPRNALLCCCLCGAIVLATLATVALILCFTIFKLKDPTLAMDSVSVDKFRLNVQLLSSHPVTINVTLVADMAVKNPNMASFQIGESAMQFYVDGETDMVGVGYVPPEKVGALRMSTVRVTVDVLVDRVQLAAVASAVVAGEVGLTSQTEVKGKVSMLWGLYTREAKVAMSCRVMLHVSLAKVQAELTTCTADVR